MFLRAAVSILIAKAGAIKGSIYTNWNRMLPTTRLSERFAIINNCGLDALINRIVTPAAAGNVYTVDSLGTWAINTNL